MKICDNEFFLLIFSHHQDLSFKQGIQTLIVHISYTKLSLQNIHPHSTVDSTNTVKNNREVGEVRSA